MDHEQNTPPRIKPRLKAAPKIREFFWCDFPTDAQLPEFWKRRPVIVISYRNKLHTAVTVVPCSTQPQDNNPWAYKLTVGVDGQESWAICDKITNVAVSRLSADKTGTHRVTQDEFDGLLALVLKWLPVPGGDKT